MSDPVIFRSLAVKHTAGFPNERLRPMQFCPGINVIIGPNASGKTTTARALQSVLWPQTGQPDTFLIAEVACRDQQGRVVYSGGRCQIDASLTLPTFGDATVSQRYMLAQHELLAAQETGQEFVRSILREASGGIDLELAREGLGYHAPSRGRSSKEYLDAVRSYRNAKEAELALQRDEAQIDALSRCLAAAERAQQSSQRLQLAMKYQAQIQDIARLSALFDAYPPELAGLTGNELGILDEFVDDHTSACAEGEAARRDIESAQLRLGQTTITDPDAVEQAVASVRALAETAASLEQQMGIAKAECLRAESDTQSAYANLGAQDTTSYADPLAVDTVTALEEFVRSVDGVSARQDSLKAQGHWLDSITPPVETHTRATLQHAIHLLRQWMVVEPATTTQAPWLPVAGGIAGLVAVVAGLLAAFVGKSPYGFLAVVGGIVAVVLCLLMRGTTRDTITRSTVEQQIAALQVIEPTWTLADVEHALHSLEARLAALDVRENTLAKRRELSLVEEQLAGEMEALEPERLRIATQLGTDPARAYAHGHVGLLYFVTQLLHWQQQRTQLAKAKAIQHDLEGAWQTALAQANEILTVYGYAPAASSGEARNFAQLLDARRTSYVQAKADIHSAAQRKSAQEAHAMEVMTKCQAWLSRLALEQDPDGARLQLARLLPQLAAYRDSERQLHDAKAVCAEMMREGQQYTEWDALVVTDDDELRRQYDQAIAQVNQINVFTAERAQCMFRVQQGKAQAACETAQATVDRLKSKLGERLEQALHAAVGDFLLRQLHATAVEAALPDVFHLARDRFAEYTCGRYELRVHRDCQEFRAFDTIDQAERTLDQLSSATRIQLLMAVRVAFVERSEQGMALPLLMDETLACSDAIREHAIITTMLEVCRGGRQVFYFTSKPHEAATWEALAREADIPCCVLHIDEHPEVSLIQPTPQITRPIPVPAQMPYAEYGITLGVPQLDFAKTEGMGAHIWYVLDSTESLYTLLEAGITTCGQMSNPSLRPFIAKVLGDTGARKALALTDLLKHLEALWHEGRGQQLTPQALHDTGILSTETFRKEIINIAEQCQWDASQLLAQLRDGQVKRLRADSIDRFADYCEEHGYLVDGDPFSPAMMSDQLLGYATPVIEQGVISVDEVRRLCHRVLPITLES